MSRAACRSSVLACVVSAVLFIRVAFAAPGPSFATPEAAVLHFVKRLAADDLEGAMQAFNIEEAMARVEVSLKARMKPSSSRTLARVARINVVAELASATRRFVYGLLLDDAQHQAIEASDANIDRFIRAVNPARLGPMRIVRIDMPVASIMRSAKGIAQMKERAASLGVEDWTERIALFQLDGAYYRGGFTLLRYGNTWRIGQLQSIYGRVEMSDRPVRKTTLEEYEELTK